ncbi:MAG TPA: type II toxin-antitoxin system VapC family toxin [Desulfuromonadales bacterium]|nr:type II toxin-antitoxin system VapC family toxin [Desulfuromonadales bacterium]
MIAVDTNILVRYAVKDDRKQTVAATNFLKSNHCRILKTVLLEVAWVLSSSSGYHLSRSAVVERLRHICGLPTIVVEDASDVARAIGWYEQGMDIADALHLTASISCSGFATLDKRLVAKGAKIAGESATILSVI